MGTFLFILGVVAVGIFLVFGLTTFIGAPYVPSQRRYMKRALTKLYPLHKKDVLVDVGSGDGKVLRYAASIGARAVGYEVNPILVGISRLLSRGNNLVETRLADFWLATLPDETTIVYVFAVSRDTARIAKKLQQEVNRMGRDVSVVSYGSELEALTPVRQLDAYHLYTLQPQANSV